MPAPSVAVPYAQFLRKCDRHTSVVSGLGGVAEPKLRRLLAELVLMRLFDDFQEAVEGVALRLACGAAYADGTSPTLIAPPARSTLQARGNFENFGRGGKRIFVKWSKYTFINDSVKFVIDTNDPFVAACRANSSVISEMQAIRNRIAHSSTQSYPAIVRRYYGASFNHVTPGVLLLSAKNSPPLLERYIVSCRILAKGFSCS